MALELTRNNGSFVFISFQGEEQIPEITGKPELHYPEWKRNLFRYFVSIPVISVCLFVVFITVFLILELQVKNVYEFLKYILIQYSFQQWWDGVINSQGYFQFLKFLPKILLAVVIPIIDGVYNNIAVWLNDMGEKLRKAHLFALFPKLHWNPLFLQNPP